jgi:hypothetical protein
MWKIVNPATAAGILSILGLLAAATGTAQQSPGAIQRRDGQHDFDFNIGTWTTHIQRLQQPLSGSTSWVQLNGTVTVHRIWEGRAQYEEIEADGATGHFEGMTLFLQSRFTSMDADLCEQQWRQSESPLDRWIRGRPWRVVRPGAVRRPDHLGTYGLVGHQT